MLKGFGRNYHLPAKSLRVDENLPEGVFSLSQSEGFERERRQNGEKKARCGCF